MEKKKHGSFIYLLSVSFNGKVSRDFIYLLSAQEYNKKITTRNYYISNNNILELTMNQ